MLWKAAVICWLKTRRPCGMTHATPLLFSNTLSSHKVVKVASDNLTRGGGMQADNSIGGVGWGGGVLEDQSSSIWRKTGWRARTWGSDESSLHPAVTIVANERCAQPPPPPLSPLPQDLNRAVTVTGASLSSLQDCCQPKGSAVTYICQALLALPTSENHFSLNFIMAYLFVFSIVWFELRAPSVGFAEGKLVSMGWTLHFRL